jgi:hypothetical protein
MLRHHKITIFFIFISIACKTSGQSIVDMHTGIYSTYFSSSSFKSAPGFGLEFGGHSQGKLSRFLDLFSDFYVYYTSFSVTGSNYTPTDTTLPPANATTKLGKLGLNYTIAFNGYLVPDKLSLQAGGGIAFNDISVIGVPNANNLDILDDNPVNASLLIKNLAGYKFDYGLRFGLCYRLPKAQICVGWFRGLKNITQGTNMNTTTNDLMFSVHFSLTEKSIAKPYQNKRIK